jgi:hypothetical protein
MWKCDNAGALEPFGGVGSLVAQGFEGRWGWAASMSRQSKSECTVRKID